jgi:hypothetical protein
VAIVMLNNDKDLQRSMFASTFPKKHEGDDDIKDKRVEDKCEGE